MPNRDDELKQCRHNYLPGACPSIGCPNSPVIRPSDARCPHNIPKGQCPDPSCVFSVNRPFAGTVDELLANKVEEPASGIDINIIDRGFPRTPTGESKPLTFEVLLARHRDEIRDLSIRHQKEFKEFNEYVLGRVSGLEAHLAAIGDKERNDLFRALRSMYCLYCGSSRTVLNSPCKKCDRTY